MSIRVTSTAHRASGSSTVTSEEGLAGLVERTLGAARAPARRRWPGLARRRLEPAVDVATRDATSEPGDTRGRSSPPSGVEAARYRRHPLGGVRQLGRPDLAAEAPRRARRDRPPGRQNDGRRAARPDRRIDAPSSGSRAAKATARSTRSARPDRYEVVLGRRRWPTSRRPCRSTASTPRVPSGARSCVPVPVRPGDPRRRRAGAGVAWDADGTPRGGCRSSTPACPSG